MSPTISIVTPSFNQAQFLDETIRSVITQDYPNVEYLIYDAGSTDGSVEIIRKYEKRIGYWVSEPDKGQADAINRGWQRSHGEILAWLNSDDTYEPGAISAIVETFQSNPQIDVVCGDCAVIDENSEWLKDLPAGQFSLRMILAGNSLPQQAVFCRRSAVEQAGWLDANLRYVFDWALWLQLGLLEANFYHLPKHLANFRLWGESKTGIGTIGSSLSGGLAFARERNRVISGLLNQAQAENSSSKSKMLRTAWLGSLLELGLLSFLEGNQKESSSYLTQFTEAQTAPLTTLPYPEMLAAHLAYCDKDIEKIVDSFFKQLDCKQALSSGKRSIVQWKKVLLSETFLVRAWNATQQRRMNTASHYFRKALKANPKLLFTRRVLSPTIKTLLKSTVSSLAKV